MPVRKFRARRGHDAAAVATPGDPALDRAIALVLNTAAQMTPLRFPPGVRRHRSIEEMDTQQDNWRRSR